MNVQILDSIGNFEMSQDINWEFDDLAFRIAQLIKEHLYSKKFFSELRELKTPTDKAVYQHILFRGPSSYSHIRKALKFGDHGLSNSLNRMRKSGFIYITGENQNEIVSRKENSENLREIVAHLTKELERSERAFQIRKYEEILLSQRAHEEVPSSSRDAELEAIESELFSLYDKEFEDKWPQWMDEYKLTRTESKKIRPLVRNMIKSGERIFRVEAFLSRFVDSKTPMGRERIRSYNVRIYGKKVGKELAEREIDFFNKLRGQM